MLFAAAAAVPSSFASLIPGLDQDSNDVGRLQGWSTICCYWSGFVIKYEGILAISTHRCLIISLHVHPCVGIFVCCLLGEIG